MQTIILVHGMGNHTADTTKQTFTQACQQALGLYPALKDKKVGDYVNIEAVGYNDIFDNHRKAMADRAQSVDDRLNALGGLVSGGLGDLTELITRIETSLGDDSFIATHWLDVFFYRFTTLGENVRIRLGQKILEVLKQEQSQHIHVVGHSLGTAVTHDTLAKLYSDNFIPGETDYLSTRSEKLGSIHMVANTSRVLESFVKVKESTAKPGAGGCCSKYYEYRHRLDPITWVKPFNPTDNNNWISHDSFRFRRYQLFQPTSITNEHGNTHSLAHYIFNPMVHLPLFRTAFDMELSDSQIEKGHDAYIARTLSGVAGELEDALDELRVKDQNSIDSLILAAKTLKDYVESIGGQWDA
ncbi:MAG: hypothetical protein HKN34_09395 [Gammaproteobacteria bacterium]|nr:hypothetical protein [Gammaproteobacteria bacterium]